MIHCKAILANTQQQFFITFVYGLNTLQGRLALWEDLKQLSFSLHGPWCVMGDLNAVLHPGDRIGGDDVQHGEVADFAHCL